MHGIYACIAGHTRGQLVAIYRITIEFNDKKYGNMPVSTGHILLFSKDRMNGGYLEAVC